MKITPKIKKIIIISLTSILGLTFFIWYFYPVLLFNLFWYQNDFFHQYLRVTPVSIHELKSPPADWEEIIIGDLTLKLPMAEYNKVSGKKNYIYFCSDKKTLLVSDIVPSKQILKMVQEEKIKYPTVSYKDELATFGSTPADVSLFNSRTKNLTGAQNLILKAIAIPNGGLRKALNISTEDLKALCILSEKRDKGYHAITYLYSQNEKVCISLIMKNYKNMDTLEADLLSVLGGIKMPDHMGDEHQISKDINSILNRFNKT